jgi:branched-chain amino acid transport system ATP-binding protein
MNLLEVNNLMVFYENAIGINNVTLTCKKGGITGIFGANSAGKTTLMFTLSGIILDTAKKERMKGGIRIAVMGDILFRDRHHDYGVSFSPTGDSPVPR